MSTTSNAADTLVTSGEDVIRTLHEAFAAQRAAALHNPTPSVRDREHSLRRLAATVLAHRTQIEEALDNDFAVHPAPFTDLVEILGVAGRATYAAEHVADWMRPNTRTADDALFGAAEVAMTYQPKGVIGLISPWNFPFDLSLGPLADMLAAGNRVIIKPSEYTPACSAVLSDLIRHAFDPDQVTVVTGGLQLAQAFPTLAWDHLLYTGNPEVGRSVARAAAENLVPTTLELGGKCPAIVHSDSVDPTTVSQIVGTKLVKNGQMCITVDYCLVPRTRLDEFIDLVTAHLEQRVPGFSSSSDCTGIITDHHLQRLLSLVQEARDRGVRVVSTEDIAPDLSTRRLPLTLVIDPPDDLAIMREEIFGPILPIKTYDALDDAIGYVNAGDRPLGLYVFAHDETIADHVLGNTVSGGACVNTCAIQGAIPALGFGGIGRSGTGRHHGIEGFREFSNPRGVVRRGSGDLIEVMYPPYGEMAKGVTEAAFSATEDGPQ